MMIMRYLLCGGNNAVGICGAVCHAVDICGNDTVTAYGHAVAYAVMRCGDAVGLADHAVMR